MKVPSKLLWLSEKVLENKVEALSLGVVGFLIGIAVWIQSEIEAYLSKVFPTPDISLVSILIELLLLLLLSMCFAYLWFRRRYVSPKPNLSGKTDLQNKILGALKTEPMSCWIAQNLYEEESRIIRNLHILKTDLLVTQTGSSSWRLTEHAYKYLHPKP